MNKFLLVLSRSEFGVPPRPYLYTSRVLARISTTGRGLLWMSWRIFGNVNFRRVYCYHCPPTLPPPGGGGRAGSRGASFSPVESVLLFYISGLVYSPRRQRIRLREFSLFPAVRGVIPHAARISSAKCYLVHASKENGVHRRVVLSSRR